MRPSQARREFPFWQVVFSVALGVLLANAVMAGAAAVMARVALQQAAEELDRLNRESAAESQRQRERLNAQSAERKVQQQRAREAERDQREGRYVQAARADAAVGTMACLSDTMVRREANGWTQLSDAASAPIKCRTVP